MLHEHTGVCWLHLSTRETPVLTVGISSYPLASSWLQPKEASGGQQREWKRAISTTDLGLPSLTWDLAGWLLAMSCGQRMLLLWRRPSVSALPRWPWRAKGWRLLSPAWSLYTVPEFHPWPTPSKTAHLLLKEPPRQKVSLARFTGLRLKQTYTLRERSLLKREQRWGYRRCRNLEPIQVPKTTLSP